MRRNPAGRNSGSEISCNGGEINTAGQESQEPALGVGMTRKKLEGSLITASAAPLRRVSVSKHGDICSFQIKIYLRKYERRK